MDWLKELFYIWQEREVYRKDDSYSRIIDFMEKNLPEEQASELEDFIADLTHEYMLDAFRGGFSVCRNLFLTNERKNNMII